MLRYALANEIEAVIEALEETDVETSSAGHFVFTSNHDIMVPEGSANDPSAGYPLVCYMQWQNGILIPVYPVELKEEAGATYIFPDWPGPWDEIT